MALERDCLKLKRLTYEKIKSKQSLCGNEPPRRCLMKVQRLRFLNRNTATLDD